MQSVAVGDDRYKVYFYIGKAAGTSVIDPSDILTDATLSSGNRHPFVCFADIFRSANGHTLVTS